MAINVLPLSGENPLLIDDAEYDRLVNNTEGGWSRCGGEREWLAKLHYLRSGYEADRLNQSQFEERETRLVLEWLRRAT